MKLLSQAVLALCALAWLAACSTIESDSAVAGTAIVGARIYTSPDADPIDNGVILIRGGRIERVGSRGRVSVPAGYEVIDQTGRFATAGFMNMHVHLTTPVYLTVLERTDAEIQAELERTFTRWGFTTVFDLASTSAIASDVEGRISSGRVLGPRVLSVGEPFYPSGGTPVYARPFHEAFGLPSSEISNDVDAAARAVRQFAQGADGIKLFTGSILGEVETGYMAASSVAALVRVAQNAGKPVLAHPTDQRGLELAVDNGVSAFAHAAPLMGPWSDAFAGHIAARGVALIPTLSLFELHPHPSTPVDVAVQQVQALHRAGGLVLFGTDAGFAEQFDTSIELRLLERSLGWRGVLAALTTGPAMFLGEEHERGRIAPGYLADIVILAVDPADGAASMARVHIVLRNGKVIYPAP